ncbi:hypothetical protein AUP68_12918 [Ilyonectria robusta]
MPEGEGGPAPNQAQGQSQGSRGGNSRGGRRRGRGGRGRGRGNGNGASRGGRNAPTEGDAPAPSSVATAQPAAQLDLSSTPESSGASRGRRGRRGGRSGGARGSETQPRGSFQVGPQRRFGGRLTSNVDEVSQANTDAQLSLSADAPEFVPGQPVATRSSEPHPQAQTSSRSRNRRKPKKTRVEVPKSTASELWQRIQEDISNFNYECRVCTEEITRECKVWSCTTCWTVVHLNCAQEWYDSSMKIDNSSGDPVWRCPGCNSHLSEGPNSYHCWCGKETSPSQTSNFLPPHSCGQTCSKPKSTCPHPCPLQCHAGPCPPCAVLSPPEPCYCGKQTNRKPCRETDYHNGWSCQEACGDFLSCGEHMCSQPCHPGLCGDCPVPISAKCYCGKVGKEMKCSQQDDVCDSYDPAKDTWFTGSFNCGNTCGRAYDCGVHTCETSCHAQDELPAHCPLAPDVVTHCPCGKTLLEDLMDHPRGSCEDEISHCDKPCQRLLPCGHLCTSLCHIGDCSPCGEIMDIDCRCGRVTNETICHQGDVQNPLCFKVCQATRNCGRHRCGERCCSGDKKAQQRIAQQKKKRSGVDSIPVEAEHICLQVCGRPLKCGSHACEKLCHRGPCSTCPEAVWEEISCSCGTTVLQPPQPCGTRQPYCTSKCRRHPACGHPTVDHQCHSDDVECPPCPYLTEKTCACGKKTFANKPCHLQLAHCGEACGQKLQCGLHACRKLCHRPGECGDAQNGCEQVCGKTKLFCNHTCQNVCHGQTPCNESNACQMKMFVACPCGNRKKEFKCLAGSLNPEPVRPEQKCDEECERLDRNRRLAAALNIDPATHTNDHVPFSDNTLKLYKEFTTWGDRQESEFRVFAANQEEVRLRYEPMRNQSRQFLHLLAEDFGLESKSDDYDTQRAVVVWKTERFVSAPSKTLAQCVKIRAAQAAQAAAEAAIRPPSPPAMGNEPFNSFVLTTPRFGITIEEITAGLETDLATLPSFQFKTEFTTHIEPNDEVFIKATAQYAAFLTSSSVETSLTSLKPRLEQTLSRDKLAEGILLCHIDTSGAVTRREAPRRPGAGGWSAVAGRAASWRTTSAAEDEASKAPGRRFVGLRKKKPQQPEAGKVWAALDGDVEC